MSQKKNRAVLLQLWAIVNGFDEKDAERIFEERQRQELRNYQVEEWLVENAETGKPVPKSVTKGEIRAARKRFQHNKHLKVGICYGEYIRGRVLSRASVKQSVKAKSRLS